jgi:hypothetical protein
MNATKKKLTIPFLSRNELYWSKTSEGAGTRDLAERQGVERQRDILSLQISHDDARTLVATKLFILCYSTLQSCVAYPKHFLSRRLAQRRASRAHAPELDKIPANPYLQHAHPCTSKSSSRPAVSIIGNVKRRSTFSSQIYFDPSIKRMPILAIVAIRLSSPGQARLQTVVSLVEAVVSVAVLVGALGQSLFCVVGGHDCCDGEDEGRCNNDFDDCCHCFCEVGGGWGGVRDFVVVRFRWRGWLVVFVG